MIAKVRFEVRRERYPFFCQWELTCRCNLHCVMCYTDCRNKPEHVKRELSTAEVFRVMDELKEAGVAQICFTGGEPMARGDFFAIHERAHEAGILTILFTNGTLIDERAADRLAESPPSRVEITLHGVSAGTFEAVTAGPGSFEECIKAIRLLNERRIPLLLKATAMTLNASELLAIKAYARDAGAAFRLGESMRGALDGDEAPMRYAISDEDWAALASSDPDIERETCAREGSAPACRSGETSFHIDAYGMLQLCSGNRREGFDLRKGAFKAGFYDHLPTFRCARKAPGLIPLTVLASHG